MTVDTNIINGKIFTPEGFLEGGISIERDRIIKVGKEPSLSKASNRIDAKGALILPGLIDIHVHFRDLEQENKETMITGTRSAIAGGITSVLDMPNNKPPTNTAQRVKNKKQIIEGKAAANIGFYSLLPENTKEIKPLFLEGIFGFKIYPASPIYPPKDNQKLLSILKSQSEYKIPLIVHLDNGYADESEKMLLEKNIPVIDAFLKSHNQIEEAKALKDFIELSKTSKNSLHCSHVTAKKTVELIEKNQDNNNLSSEICVHHLFLTANDLRKMGSQAKCLPPVRTHVDQTALWEALNSGLINIIATDHAPHSYKEKHCEFESAASGIHGLETMLPLMFTAAAKGQTSFEKIIPALTVNPAQLMDINYRGELKQGYYADVVVVEKKKRKIIAENFESKAKWTPFDGREVLFTPKYVLVNGLLSKDEDFIITKANAGKILERKYDVKLQDEMNEDEE
ncbi:MAG: dihydroorotase family protein [Candidatus Heimdallarchaeota archaeon]|nr:dihydroorotase family protein [Candidatus Heimdallarchaeota archaeon]MBY8993632.1 dihydroorotase family protein [Candidatus Heimdallarchaeota archaeon]